MRPSDVVGAIANEAGIPGRVIGAIDIYDEFTLVDVPAEFKQQVLGAMAGAKMRNLPVSIRVARPGLEDGERTPPEGETAARRPPRGAAGKRTAQHMRPRISSPIAFHAPAHCRDFLLHAPRIAFTRR